MPDLPRLARPALTAAARTLRASMLAALGAAAIEVVLGAAKTGGEVHYTAGDVVTAMVAAVGLWGLFGLCCGLLLGAVAAGVAASLPEPGATRALLRRIATEPELDRAVAGGLVALAIGVLVEVIVVRGYVLAVALQMASRKNTATSTGLVAAGTLGLLAVAAPALFHAGRGLARLVPRPRTYLLVGLGVLGLAGAAALVLGSLDWRVMNFGPYRGLALYAALLVGHLAFWGTIGRARYPALVRTPRPQLLLVAVLLVSAAAFVFAWRSFGGSPRAVRLLAEETGLARTLVGLGRALSDRDRDGYSPRLGGGDCNDADPAVNPGADDVPGNGVDEDCDGQDTPERVARAATISDRPRTWDPSLNLLVITVDTLRADRLDEARMPRTAALAKRSARFDTAYAQAPNTPRSFPSFLVGRLPSQVRWASRNLNFPPLVPSSAGGDPTFFEELARAGLSPIGVFSHFYLEPKNGISGGFASWDNAGALTLHDSNTDIAAPRITERVVKKLKELATKKTRFALWTHLFDPHSKYMDHPEFPVKGSGFAALEQRYDGEVSFTDKHIGIILDALEAAGLAEKTIVVVMADHGESFGEHKFAGERMFFHGETIYDENLKVPLVIHVPGLAPRVVSQPVMLIDLGPTLLDLAGRTPPSSMQGRSLVPALRGEAMPEVPVFAELLPVPSWKHKWRSIRMDGYKLLDKQSENAVELYDLAHDPTEQHDLAGAQPERVKALRQVLIRGL